MTGINVHNIGDLALPVFAFYMLVLANFMGETLGCNLQKIMRESMIAKHFVGFILLLFLLIFSEEGHPRPLPLKIALAAVIYVWFFVTTKCPAPIMMAVLTILLISYIIGKQFKDDPEYLEDKGNVRTVQTLLSSVALVLSMSGFVLYLLRKRHENGTGFSLKLLLTDTLRCAHRK